MSAPEPQRAPPSRRHALALALGAAILGGALACGWLWVSARAEPRPPSLEMLAAHAKAQASTGLPELWKLPAFSFDDHQNRATTNESLAGKPWIVDFVFTTCTTVCPLLTAKMRLLQRKLPEPGIGFLSFSVDPAHDTPQALAAYRATWNPNESRWLLLSTDAKGLSALATGMRVLVEPTADAKDPILHSSSFFLVDGAGTVRGAYNSNDDDELARLARDTRSLLPKAPAREAARPALAAPELFAALGCGPCHDNHELAPALAGVFGREVVLSGGERLRADAAYLRESIVAPGKKLTAGYLNLMPSYAAELSEAELTSLVEYIQSLPIPGPARAPSPSPSRPAAPGAARAAAGPSAEAAAPPNEIRTDPVCQMDVRLTESTPHAAHAGKEYYFCSAGCRTRFVAAPESYLKEATAPGM